MQGERPDADEWLQRLGLEVILRDLHGMDESISGCVIMLRSSLSPRAKRWATFHAIAHTQLHRGNQLRLLHNGERHFVRKQERQAEEWTARLLVPGGELLDLVEVGLEGHELAEHFDVPEAGIELAYSLIGSPSSVTEPAHDVDPAIEETFLRALMENRPLRTEGIRRLRGGR